VNTKAIPVDLLNPGQVFACLGFLEAADVVIGRAEGGFECTEGTDARFQLCAVGDEDAFRSVLQFLAQAQLRRLVPAGYTDPRPSDGGGKRKKRKAYGEESQVADTTTDGPLVMLDTFPGPNADWRALPVRLDREGRQLDITHWADASSRNDFKLFAGQQRAAVIARAMLEKVSELWNSERRDCLVRDPFGLTMPLGGSSFKFDARKSWTAIDVGYSPDEQNHLVAASPVVEILAAIGLEHARPDEFDTREMQYGTWGGLVPPTLARAALAGVDAGIPRRMFRFTLHLSGKNKVVTFAEEASP
jgi:CRISPR-associated protein Csx14